MSAHAFALPILLAFVAAIAYDLYSGLRVRKS